MKNLAFYAVVVVGYLAYGAITDADRDNTGAIVGEGNIDAFQLRVGDCFNDGSSMGEEVSDLPGVPCDEPHDYETYAVFDVALQDYPSDDEMSELAYESCLERFDGFVGLDYEDSILDIVTLYPTTESWQQNDREVVCALYDINEEKLVGSTQGRAI
ncbi:MAG: septum formation family protein [Woeseiaceae bacterium]